MSSLQLESEHLPRVCGNHRRVSRVAVTMSLYMKIASDVARYDLTAMLVEHRLRCGFTQIELRADFLDLPLQSSNSDDAHGSNGIEMSHGRVWWQTY